MFIFVSYAHNDKPLVRPMVVTILQTAGHTVWFDVEILPGQEWEKEILTAINACDAFVYAMTPASLASQFCRWEFETAIKLGKPVVPVLLLDSEVPEDIAHIQYVDFRDGATGEAAVRLVTGLQHVPVSTINFSVENAVPPPTTAETSSGAFAPLRYRQSETEFVMQQWRSAASISLVGIGSVGKTNFLSHLTDKYVHNQYLGKDHRIVTILLDSAGFVPLTDAGEGADGVVHRVWAAFELMLHELRRKASEPDVGLQGSVSKLDEIYTKMLASHPSTAVRYFELALDLLLSQRHVVFIFDEFESMLSQFPVKFFTLLRWLRDRNKSKLSFVTYTRSPLSVIVEQFNIPLLEIEPFIELFVDNILYVGPYSQSDARQMLLRLQQRSNIDLPEEAVNFILEVTGGFAGLLRGAMYALRLNEQPSTINWQDKAMRERYIQQIASHGVVRTECSTIWHSLTSQEQNILKLVVKPLVTSFQITPEAEVAIATLIQKRLIVLVRDQGRLEINPPLFLTYVEQLDT